jgi:sensor histidine kinase YesM
MIFVLVVCSLLCAYFWGKLYDILPLIFPKRINTTILRSRFSIIFPTSIIAVFLSFLYRNIIYNLTIQQKIRLTWQQKQVLNQVALEAELLELKNQINPHFIYNSLNFIYAQALNDSEKLAKSILLLSDIMRYSVQDIHGRKHLPLQLEIKHVENIVQLQTLKHETPLNIQLTVNGNTEFRYILPLSIAYFIETTLNYFIKNHSNDQLQLAFIIHENIVSIVIVFIVEHLMNLRTNEHIFTSCYKQLNEIYPNNTTFKIQETSFNTVQYTIQINL